MLSEEEIKEIIKDFLELREIHSSDSAIKSYLSIYQQAIQGLLDLYQQEKEKNKELYEDNQKQWAERCKLAIELDNNTVSKDKIREFIKEETKEGTYNFKTISSDRLLEFLEENK